MSERSEVKRDGAKAQKNSGRGDYQKGDAKWNQFLTLVLESLTCYNTNLAFYFLSLIPQLYNGPLTFVYAIWVCFTPHGSKLK